VDRRWNVQVGAGSIPDMTDTLLALATKAVAKRSFCTLATSSDAGRPHVAGVIYSAVGTTFYVSTLRDSRKARNIAANPRVAVSVPVRRLPIGPPSAVQFQGTAEILDNDDPHVRELAAAGRLKAISAHGELELPTGCVLRITPGRRLITYGLGMSLRRLLRDPLDAAGVVELPASSAA
jgi:general stress protein 26